MSVPTYGRTSTVALTVNAINDAPVNFVPGVQEINEDNALVFSASTGNGLSVGDVDDADNAAVSDENLRFERQHPMTGNRKRRGLVVWIERG